MFKKFYVAELNIDKEYVEGKMIFVNPLTVASIKEFEKEVTSISFINGKTFNVMGSVTEVASILEGNTTEESKKSSYDSVEKFIRELSAK